jgi:hypothetical protein
VPPNDPADAELLRDYCRWAEPRLVRWNRQRPVSVTLTALMALVYLGLRPHAVSLPFTALFALDAIFLAIVPPRRLRLVEKANSWLRYHDRSEGPLPTLPVWTLGTVWPWLGIVVVLLLLGRLTGQ